MAVEQEALLVQRQPYHAEPIRPSVSGLSNLALVKSRVDLRALYHDLTGESAGGVAIRSRGRRGVRVLCPFHNDSTPSLAIFYDKPDDQFYHCYTCKASGDCVEMVMVLRGVDFLGAVTFLGLQGELAYHESEHAPTPVSVDRRIVRVTDRMDFIFRDEHGTPLYKEVRTEGLDEQGKKTKKIGYRHPEPTSPGHCVYCKRYFTDDPSKWNFHIDRWGFGMDGIPVVPYELPELLRRSAVGADITLVEGAKKAQLLRRIGLFATTNVGGATFQYPDEWKPYFEGVRRAFVFQDCDLRGRIAGLDRAAFLRSCGVDATHVELDPTEHEGYGVDDISEELRFEREPIIRRLQHAIQRTIATPLVDVVLTNRETEDREDVRFFPLTRQGLDASRAIPSRSVTIERTEGESVRSKRFYEEVERVYAIRNVPITWTMAPQAPTID